MAKWVGDVMDLGHKLSALAGAAGASGRLFSLRVPGWTEVLRQWIRYLVDGAVPGGRASVDELLTPHRERFGLKRPDGARPARGLPGISTLRALRLRVMG